MDITAKNRRNSWSNFFTIIFCLVIVLSTELHLGNTQIYLKGVQIDILGITNQITHLFSVDANATSLLFWHLLWFGVVLSICGLLGIWVALSRARHSENEINNFNSAKSIQERVPAHG